MTLFLFKMPASSIAPKQSLRTQAVHGGRLHAAQVCLACKARKKRCNKALPRCNFCTKKGLSCRYTELPKHRPVPQSRSLFDKHTRRNVFSAPESNFTGAIYVELASSEASICAQVVRLIRDTGQFPEDICSHYFDSIHHCLPVISQERFQTTLVTLGSTPSVGFSMLLLSILLLTSTPRPDPSRSPSSSTRKIDRVSLYLTARALFAQVQALYTPTKCLIQAGLLLSMYEYVQGRPDAALTSLAACARMAYAHCGNRFASSSTGTSSEQHISRLETDIEYRLGVQEATTTWWGLVICERAFLCDATTFTQPCITDIPIGDNLLSAKSLGLNDKDPESRPSVQKITMFNLISTTEGGFGCAAQITCFTDDVFSALRLTERETRLAQLRDLDKGLQAYLGLLMHARCGRINMYCQSISLGIRTLFVLHNHILEQAHESQRDGASFSDELSKYACSALDVATKMILDIIHHHIGSAPIIFKYVTTSYPYSCRAALKYVTRKLQWSDEEWLRKAREDLTVAIEDFNNWNRDEDTGGSANLHITRRDWD
ncbi:hypothetical protein F5Y18DRAFT_133595 [Xylariaceae sp. FL1019]|nr:hypothetical protein F5Y18DRAFT_133595 [Xylariaceae sp. FL1019]